MATSSYPLSFDVTKRLITHENKQVCMTNTGEVSSNICCISLTTVDTISEGSFKFDIEADHVYYFISSGDFLKAHDISPDGNVVLTSSGDARLTDRAEGTALSVILLTTG